MIVKYKYKANENIMRRLKIGRKNEKALGRRRAFWIAK
jgi:hypothetical protein